jgi:hypothetical protein
MNFQSNALFYDYFCQFYFNLIILIDKLYSRKNKMLTYIMTEYLLLIKISKLNSFIKAIINADHITI